MKTLRNGQKLLTAREVGNEVIGGTGGRPCATALVQMNHLNLAADVYPRFNTDAIKGTRHSAQVRERARLRNQERMRAIYRPNDISGP